MRAWQWYHEKAPARCFRYAPGHLRPYCGHWHTCSNDVGAPLLDPYLWLEDIGGDEPLNWVREHNAITTSEFSGARFEEMRDEALAILNTDAQIPYVRRRGEYLYNFWRDATNSRGLWRRTTLDRYRRHDPEWDVVIDVDALAATEDENWVWAGAAVLRPDFQRALVSLSRGGSTR